MCCCWWTVNCLESGGITTMEPVFWTDYVTVHFRKVHIKEANSALSSCNSEPKTEEGFILVFVLTYRGWMTVKDSRLRLNVCMKIWAYCFAMEMCLADWPKAISTNTSIVRLLSSSFVQIEIILYCLFFYYHSWSSTELGFAVFAPMRISSDTSDCLEN